MIGNAIFSPSKMKLAFGVFGSGEASDGVETCFAPIAWGSTVGNETGLVPRGVGFPSGILSGLLFDLPDLRV